MPSISFSAVILAAGKGSRMHSTRPKVLHPLAGKPMVQHVIDTVAQLGARQCYLVYGHEGEQLKAALCHQPLHWVLQTEQRGTGHALQQVLPDLPRHETLLVLYGDVPLISAETLQRLLAIQPPKGISLLTAHLAAPTGYGRIIRQNGQIVAIVEQQEATPEQQQIKEINSGILAANSADLKRWLSQLSHQNASGEYYLTDIIALAHVEGCGIHCCYPTRTSEVQGVNTRLQLAHLEREYQILQAQQLLLAGVTVCDPARFDLRGELLHGQDVVIESNVILQGRVKLGDRVTVGAGCLLFDCTIGDDCQIKPYTIIEKSSVGAGCSVGPFAHLRPGSELQSAAKVGNFVEIKKTRVGKHSKVNHLSYLGDAEIGDGVNIGAGTITCNYNGVDKLNTVIGNDVFVGADTQLVAPVTIASGATIGAGTTVTQDVAAGELVLSRVPQRHIQSWRRPTQKAK